MAKKSGVSDLLIIGVGSYVIIWMAYYNKLGHTAKQMADQIVGVLKGFLPESGTNAGLPSGASGTYSGGTSAYSTTSTVRHDGQLVLPVPPEWGWRVYPQYDPLVGRVGIYQTDDRGNFNGPIAWAS